MKAGQPVVTPAWTSVRGCIFHTVSTGILAQLLRSYLSPALTRPDDLSPLQAAAL